MNEGKNKSLVLRVRRATGIPSIALVDASKIRRTCISATLSSQGFPAVNVFERADLIDDIERYDLAIFFTDMEHMVDRRIEEQIAYISKRAINTKIVVLLDEPVEFVRQKQGCMQLASAVLHQNMEPEVLSALLQVIHMGYNVLPAMEKGPGYHTESGVSEGGAGAFKSSHPLLGKATPRQRQVLAALFAGYSNKQIARHLSISESTVKTHVYYLMQLLGAESRTQIVLKLAPVRTEGLDRVAEA
jgi:DNA-binding NarL/FixJ family response regulator